MRTGPCSRASRTPSAALTALADIERQEAAARLAREEFRRLEKRRDEVVRCFACSANDAHAVMVSMTVLLCTNKISESQRELLQAREMIDEAHRSLSSSLEEALEICQVVMLMKIARE
ncbi:unnamed protein product [Miscanthus lutarioriparius]|uniref:Uncharacterized protein n=1 Tax=Miscanthus lutarioriparius TaxID=422564 RepID=A0A811NFB4_9POAL|nr:unnamed protein product [Miscanthus lutarioriparius]